MIRETTLGDKPWLLMNHADLEAATAWARGLCIMFFGPEEGEAYFRKLPALTVLRAWTSRPQVEA